MPTFQQHFPARILIVEDQIAIALEIEAHLQSAGFQTVGPAVDVKDAVWLVAAGEFDVAVLDVGVVEKAVHDLLWSLVARRTPIVFLTTFQPSEMPSWAPRAEYVMKPCRLEELLEKVNAATNNKRRNTGRLPGSSVVLPLFFREGDPDCEPVTGAGARSFE